MTSLMYVIHFVEIVTLLLLVTIIESYLNAFRGPMFISQEFKSPHKTKTFRSQEDKSNTERNAGKLSFRF